MGGGGGGGLFVKKKTLSIAGHLGPALLAPESLPCRVRFVDGCWFESSK